MSQGEQNITLSFKADIKDLKSGISDANKSIQLANAQFKAASAGLEDWENSSDGLNAKLEQLNKILTAESKKLENYKTQLKRTNQEETKNVKTAEELRKKYEQAATQYGKTSKEANTYKAELAKVEKEIASNAKEAEKLNVTILNQEGKIASTNKELRKYESHLEKVKNAEKEVAKHGGNVAQVLKETNTTVVETGGGFTVLKGVMANLVSAGISAVISGFKEMISTGREIRLEMGRVETAFSTSGFSLKTAGKTYSDFYGILGDAGQTTEAVSHLAKLAKTEEDLAKWTNIATGVYATFGNSIPLESLTEAANETAKTGELTGALADALNWTIGDAELYGKAISKAKTEEERLNIITKALTNQYGKASKQYQVVNKDIIASNKAQLKLSAIMGKISAELVPLTTALQNGFAKLLEKVYELVNKSRLQGFAKDVSKAFDKFVDDIMPKIAEGITWFLDNKDQVIAGIVGIVSAIATFKTANIITGMIDGWVTSFQKFKKAQEGATVAQWLLNAAMSANPIGILIAAITGLVAAFIYLWHTSDSFRQFWIDLWEVSKQTFSDFFAIVFTLLEMADDELKKYADIFSDTVRKTLKAIFGFLEKIDKELKRYAKIFSDAVRNIFKKIVDILENFLRVSDEILSFIPNKMHEAFKSAIKKVVSVGSELISKGRKISTDFYNTVVNKIKEIPGKMTSIGSDIVKGLWNGIKDMIGWVKGKIDGFSESVLNGIKDFFGVKSPSKVMEKVIGNNLVSGLVAGIENKTQDAVNAMKKLSNKLIDPAKGIIEDINGGLNKTNATLSGAAVKAGPTYNYTQINNSPKALSRYEIYRQTKNALNFATIK